MGTTDPKAQSVAAEAAKALQHQQSAAPPPRANPSAPPPEALINTVDDIWRLASTLSEAEREELHARLASTLPAPTMVEAEAVASEPAGVSREMRGAAGIPPTGRWWRRAVAHWLDRMMVRAIMPGRSPAAVMVLGAVALECVTHCAWSGQTVGKKVMGLRIMRNKVGAAELSSAKVLRSGANQVGHMGAQETTQVGSSARMDEPIRLLDFGPCIVFRSVLLNVVVLALVRESTVHVLAPVKHALSAKHRWTQGNARRMNRWGSRLWAVIITAPVPCFCNRVCLEFSCMDTCGQSYAERAAC